MFLLRIEQVNQCIVGIEKILEKLKMKSFVKDRRTNVISCVCRQIFIFLRNSNLILVPAEQLVCEHIFPSNAGIQTANSSKSIENWAKLQYGGTVPSNKSQFGQPQLKQYKN